MFCVKNIGADPDNLKRGYDGKHEKESSKSLQDRLTEHFVSGSTARITDSLCGANRKTADFYFLRLREIIAYELEAESEAVFGGEIEVDESYCGGRRKEKRGCDAM